MTSAETAALAVLRRPGAAAACGLGAIALVGVTLSMSSAGSAAMPALRGAALLLAAAVVFALDEASAELLAASPTALRRRVAGRLAMAAVVVVPTWGLLVLATALRTTGVPVGGLSLELVALTLCGVALSTGLAAWRRLPEPAVVAVPVLVVGLLSVAVLPRPWALVEDQTWGPVWAAAQWRWLAVVLAAGAVAYLASADPAER